MKRTKAERREAKKRQTMRVHGARVKQLLGRGGKGGRVDGKRPS